MCTAVRSCLPTRTTTGGSTALTGGSGNVSSTTIDKLMIELNRQGNQMNELSKTLDRLVQHQNMMSVQSFMSGGEEEEFASSVPVRIGDIAATSPVVRSGRLDSI